MFEICEIIKKTNCKIKLRTRFTKLKSNKSFFFGMLIQYRHINKNPK